MGRRSEQPSAPKRSISTVPVTWPADDRARERMAAYHAELKDCGVIDVAFLETLEEHGAEDERVPAVLAEKARERFACSVTTRTPSSARFASSTGLGTGLCRPCTRT